MSREDGFPVMDVSVDIVNDPKIRKLYRISPEHAGAGFLAYMATLGESWKAGRRIPVEDAWPAVLPFDGVAVEAMIHVGLLDAKGLVSMNAWRGWFAPAQMRREAVRERWRRANAKRADSSTNDSGGHDTVSARLPRGIRADTAASPPRGSRADTAANHSVPFRTDSDPKETREIPPPPAERGRRSKGTNPRAAGAAPRERGTNPRATGTSTRQVRADRKRGATKLGDVLRRAAAQQAEDEGSWFDAPATAEAPA